MARNVNYSGAAALAAFTVSENVLAYASSPPSMIRWLSPDGLKSEAFPDPGEYTGLLRLCCGDTRVATAVVDSAIGATDLWMLDLARGSRTRLTFSPGNDGSPAWSPNGERIYYTYREAVMSKDVTNPTAKEKTVFARPGAACVPFNVSPDDRLLAVRVVDRGKRDGDLWIVPLSGDDKPFPLIETRFDEGGPQFSPDGKLLAYTSNESGRTEVYVMPFPSRTKRWQASAGGAFGSPIWHKDETAIFYVSPDRHLMRVPVTFANGEPRFGVPARLFEIPLFAEHVTVAADGSRLLMSERPMRPGASSMILVQNWRARLPGN
jgi:Tol biopolymer transport system component